VTMLREIVLNTRTSNEASHATPLAEPLRQITSSTAAPSATAAVERDQIRALVQQLFFPDESRPIRHVAFAPLEDSTATANLCLEVATVLAEKHNYDVGLIDARTQTVSLTEELQVLGPASAEATWPIAPRLWMVPRLNWLPDDPGTVTDQSLSRLRELISEFDFSILWCDPVSWLTTSVARTCDGVVLVLAANKTRRIIAEQARNHLQKAQVVLLGSVLVERRFPVPQGLYRNL